MTTPRFTLRGAHLLMWSSPLLLLVLVFTLTGSSTTPAAHHPRASRSPPRPRRRRVRRPQSPVTSTTLPPSTTTTTIVPKTPSASRDKRRPSSRPSPLPSANVASGELEGRRHFRASPSSTSRYRVRASGPLSTTSPSRNHLDCATVNARVGRLHRPARPARRCQLQDRLSHDGGVTHVATHSSATKTFGTARCTASRSSSISSSCPTWWRASGTRPATNPTAPLVRTLLVALGVFWLAFLVQLVSNIVRLRHGRGTNASGSAWLAGLMVAALPFLISPRWPPEPRLVAPRRSPRA